MKAIRDEFNLLPVLWKLGYFREYLKDVEELVDSKAKELDSTFSKRVQELEIEQNLDLEHNFPFWREDYVELSLEEDYEKIENVFPNLLRRSLFIYVFSVLEDALVNCCKLLGRPIRPEGSIIFEAKKVLVNAGVSFPKWGEIEKYPKLRNCIIHNGGRLEEDKDDEKDLRAYVKRKKKKSLLNSIPWNYEVYEVDKVVMHPGFKEDDKKVDEVIFHKGFCEEVIQTISDFLEQLRINMEYRHRNEQF